MDDPLATAELFRAKRLEEAEGKERHRSIFLASARYANQVTDAVTIPWLFQITSWIQGKEAKKRDWLLSMNCKWLKCGYDLDNFN
jgi:hypothetical protein